MKAPMYLLIYAPLLHKSLQALLQEVNLYCLWLENLPDFMLEALKARDRHPVYARDDTDCVYTA